MTTTEQATELAVTERHGGVLTTFALSAVKQVLQETQGLDDYEAFKCQNQIASGLLHGEDAHEGALAFAEKRAPVCRGR